MFKNMKMKTKLVVSFLLVSLIPLAIVSLTSINKASKAISMGTYNQLRSVREIKKSQILEFFNEREGNSNVLIETISTLRAEAVKKLEAVRDIKKQRILKIFKRIKKDTNILIDIISSFKIESTKELLEIIAEYDQQNENFYSKYAQENEYNNLFLIDKNGNIIYSVNQVSDYKTNVINGKYSNSNLGELVKKILVKKEFYFADFKAFELDNNKPAAFAGAPLLDKNGNVALIVAIQISIDEINKVMNERSGMGETGESYLIGEDMLMRSDSYLDPKHHSVFASFKNPEKGKVETKAAINALDKKSDTDLIIDYNGQYVLSAYAPIIFESIKWAIISEIDISEAFCPKDKDGNYYFKKYVDKYDYYDLYLIEPKGFCFYSVEKKSDHSTNFLSGIYSNSNLGMLIKEVIKTKKFGIVDLAPYEPSNNEPSFFIAQPLIQNGKIELILALQLSIDGLNKILLQRDGMGETGETYLIGSDMLMRSDSYLDPQNHSLKASFSNPSKGKVDTEAAKLALNGKSESKIIIDYNGNSVLSSFTPIKIKNINWALLAEIDVKEAFQDVNSTIWIIVIISIVCAIVIVIIALLIASSISKPIIKAVNAANSLAKGDLSNRLKINTTDEIGELAQAIDTIPEVLEKLIFEFNLNSKSIQSGLIEERGDHTKFEGAYSELIKICNKLTDTFVYQFNLIPVPIMIINKEFNILFMNKTGCDIIGRTSKELKNKKCYDYFKTSDCRTSNCACDRAMNSGQSVISETDAHPGGNDLEVSYSGTPIKDENNEIVGAFEVITDQTEIKNAQKIAKKVAIYQDKEVDKLSQTLQKVADCDMTVSYEVSDSDDDTKDVHNAFKSIQKGLNSTINNMANVLSSIRDSSSVLASSSEELSAVSTQLVNGSEQMNNQSNNVASATEEMASNIGTIAAAVEEMSVNISTVSSTTEEMSHNMNSVAGAVEEMTVSMNNISMNANEGKDIASKAIQLSGQATDAMNVLGEAAGEIGEVTEVIKQIAEQTNLLALNATIEAASAGDAGRGFAVVANEIKELANQSAKAAEDIAKRISGVQGNTGDAIKVIKDVSDIINKINDAVETITRSVEEQSKANTEIARNVSEATTGADNITASISELNQAANDMSKNTGEASHGANDVSANIQGVSLAAKDTNSSANQVNISAQELSKVAGQLQEMVNKFKLQ